ncbi:MAG TPA: DMT family transporter [Solirubrobacteraceae bacterium]
MTRRSWLLMGLLAALWGASYLFIKVGLDGGLQPVFIVWARIALGALVLVPIALRRGALKAVRGRGGAIVVMALVQVVVPFLLITYGERHIASGLAGILVSSAPIFTALLAARFDEDERPRGVAVAGLVLGILGVVLLFGLELSGDAEALAGGLMVLLASLGYAIGGLFLKHRLRGIAPVAIAASTMVAGALVLTPVALFALPSSAPSARAVASLLALGAGGTGLAFLIFYTLIAGIGPSRATLVTYIAPGFAVVYGVWLLSEPLGAGALLGLALILLGSWVAAEGRWPGQAKAAPAATSRPPPAREAT